MKATWGLALALLILVTAAGCAQEKKPGTPAATAEGGNAIPALAEPLIPPRYMKELGGCLKYLDTVDKCIYNRATVLRIGQLCEPIKSSELREGCFMELAPLVGVGNLCEKAGSKREDCFERLALAKQLDTECLEIAAGERRDICLKNLAVKFARPVFCTQVAEPGRRDSCFAKTSIDSNSFEACGQIVDAEMQGSCKSIVGQVQGVEEYCAEGERGDACRLLAAKNTGKQGLCEELLDAGLKSNCYAFFGNRDNDEVACAKAQGAERDACYHAIAVSLKELRLCQRIEAKGARRPCFEEAGAASNENKLLLDRLAQACAGFQGEAWQKCEASAVAYEFDAGYCDGLADANRLTCLRELNQVVRERALCNRFTEAADKNRCVSLAAAESRSAGACDEFTDRLERFACLKEVATASGDGELCQTIELSGGGAQTRYDCFEAVAVKTKTPEWCVEINFKEQQGSCVAKVAAAKEDPILCEGVKNEALSQKDPFVARDSCYLKLVEFLPDSELCAKIQDAARKEQCLAKLG